jgi:hypothetical protein
LSTGESWTAVSIFVPHRVKVSTKRKSRIPNPDS